MMFKKRHYEVIASAMQEARETADRADDKSAAIGQWIVTTEALADLFARDNPEFKRGRFEAACLPGANVRARS